MKKIVTLALAATMILGLAACGGKAPAENGGGAASTPKDSVYVTLNSVGNTMDSSVANATNTTLISDHIFDWIIGVDNDLNMTPGLATDWEFVDDLTFTFTIADGFMFHNGEPVEDEDVIYSITRNYDIPKRAAYMGNVASVEKTGENEFTIKLNEPDSATIKELMGFAQVYNKSYCEEVGEEYATKPIGTGPYKVTNFVPGDRVELERWEDYPFEKPALKSITFKAVEENSSRYISLETGEAQFSVISYQDLTRAQENAKLSVIEKVTTNTNFISMNTQMAPFDNKNVRLAMAYATDNEGLASVNGGATAIRSMTPAMFGTYYVPEGYPTYDLEKAKQLLEQEGYSASNPLTFELWTYGGNTAVAEAYQASLSTIGVSATIKNLEFGVFLEGMAGGTYQMLTGGWNNATGNILTSIENYWSESFGAQNISFFKNDKCDELYNLAKSASDEAVIADCAKQVQEIAAAEMPMIPTFAKMEYFAMDKGLKGVEIKASGAFDFRTAYYE